MGITLRHANGAEVTVSDDRAEKLIRSGFTLVSSAAPPRADYTSLTVADLKDEIARRNEGRDDPIPTTGKKADLVAALEADDR